MRQLCNVLKARAMLCLGNEDIDGFTRDAMAIVRLGRLNTQGPTLVEKLVGTGCEALGLDAIKIAISGGWLSEKQANTLLAELRAAPPRRPMHKPFEGAERGFMLEFLQVTAVHGIARAEPMLQAMGTGNKLNLTMANASTKDWNVAMKKANAWYDRLDEAGKKPTFADRIKAAGDVMRDIDALKAKYEGWKTIFEPLEDRLIVLAIPAMQRAYTTETRIAANEELIETALALNAFNTKFGEYPPRLKLLAPMYFKSEPLDPFTNKPLIYHLQGNAYELKSAGPGTGTGTASMTDLIIRAGN
jgi:hypothetical protein